MKALIGIVFVIGLITLNSALYVIDQAEQGIIVQFGEPVGDVVEHLQAGQHARVLFAVDAQCRRLVQADREEHRVVCVEQALERHVAPDQRVETHLDAERADVVDVLVELVVRQPVGRHAVAQHAAGPRLCLVHGHAVAKTAQIVGRAHAAGSRADHADRPAVV